VEIHYLLAKTCRERNTENYTPYSCWLEAAWWLRYCHINPRKSDHITPPPNNFLVPKEELRKLGLDHVLFFPRGFCR